MRSISVIFVSGPTHFGCTDMMSATVRLKNTSCDFSMARRMSPSVTRPQIFSLLTATHKPRRPRLTWITASPNFMSGDMTGRSSVRITSFALVSKRRPRVPPGWNCAKSDALNPLATIKAQAKASPIARAAVVEEVGARPRGHASCVTAVFKCVVEYFANKDSGLPLIPITGICRSRR